MKKDHPAFVRIGGALRPLDEDGIELLKTIPEGKIVGVEIISPRNIRQHRLFFALLKKIVDGGAWNGTIETLKEALKHECKLVEHYVDLRGAVHIRPKSISFASMPQEEFNRFFQRAVWACSHMLLKDDNWQALYDEIVEMVDGPINQQRRA